MICLFQIQSHCLVLEYAAKLNVIMLLCAKVLVDLLLMSQCKILWKIFTKNGILKPSLIKKNIWLLSNFSFDFSFLHSRYHLVYQKDIFYESDLSCQWVHLDWLTFVKHHTLFWGRKSAYVGNTRQTKNYVHISPLKCIINCWRSFKIIKRIFKTCTHIVNAPIHLYLLISPGVDQLLRFFERQKRSRQTWKLREDSW